MFVLATHH